MARRLVDLLVEVLAARLEIGSGEASANAASAATIPRSTPPAVEPPSQEPEPASDARVICRNLRSRIQFLPEAKLGRRFCLRGLSNASCLIESAAGTPVLCCPSVIMSSFVLDRNVPLIGLPRGGQIGANADEQEGVGTSGSAGWSAQQATAGRGCQWTAAGELPAGQAAVEAVSGGRSCGAEASQRGGRSSNRAHDKKFRQQVLRQVREKYGGAVGERFGPTLADRTLGVGGRA